MINIFTKKETEVKVVQDFPPNIEAIRAVFDLEGKKPVFTYGTTIYAPYGTDLQEHMLVHEKVHVRQQTRGSVGDFRSSPAVWWARYLNDPVFRLVQELEAYGAQYKFVREQAKDRNQLAKFLYAIASDLSGPMYGNILTYDEAVTRIKNNSL